MILKFVGKFQKIIPVPLWKIGKSIYWFFISAKFRKFGRPYVKGESSKAKQRRLAEGFFDKYIKGKGLDIGYGGDPIVEGVDVWDFEHGDAQYLNGVPENKYDFVYSSHTLEHMVDAAIAIKNWFRAVKKEGFLIIYIPHRDLYEKKKTLPSNFNYDHKHFFLPFNDESPDTTGVEQLIKNNLKDFEIVYIKECSYGHTISNPLEHSDGEYSIEVVVKKH